MPQTSFRNMPTAKTRYTMLARSCLLVTCELLNTAQDDGGNSVFIQTAANMPRGIT